MKFTILLIVMAVCTVALAFDDDFFPFDRHRVSQQKGDAQIQRYLWGDIAKAILDFWLGQFTYKSRFGHADQ